MNFRIISCSLDLATYILFDIVIILKTGKLRFPNYFWFYHYVDRVPEQRQESIPKQNSVLALYCSESSTKRLTIVSSMPYWVCFSELKTSLTID